MFSLLRDLFEAIWMMFVIVIVHEFGHFLAAYKLGLPVSSVEVGNGPRILQFSWKGMCFQLHLLPLFGCVKTCWPSKKRWKNSMISFAGPLANFILALGLYIVLGESIKMTRLDTLMTMSLYVGAFNLLPLRFLGVDSDGMQILRQLRRSRVAN